jgi:signal transduction histidine kinase
VLLSSFVVGPGAGLRAFVAAVTTAGAAAAAYSLAGLEPDDLLPLAILAIVGALAESVVFLPGGGVLHSPSTLVYLAGVLLLRTPAAVLLALLATVVAQVLARNAWYRVGFNVSQKALAIGAASLVWWTAGGTASDAHDLLQKLPWIGAASAVFYLLNSGMVSAAIAIERGESFPRIWWESRRRVLLPQLGMCALAALCAGAWLYDPRAILLLVLPAGVTWASFNQVRALEEKSANEKTLREESQRMAARWAALASAGERLDERVDPEGVLKIAADLVVEHCAHGVHLTTVGGRHVDAARETLPPALREWLLEGPLEAPAPPAYLRVLPLHAAGVDVGTLHAAWAGEPPTDEQQALLGPLTERIALAIRNAMLVEQGAEVEALRQVSRMKSEFVAAVGHELRSPLSLVIGFGELLRERPDDPAEVRFAAERIYGAGHQLARLVDDLLESGRLETGRFTLDVRPVDAREVVEAAVGVVEATNHKHRFEVVAPASLPTILSDPARVQQIVTNLLTNAARYAPADTRVGIELSTRCDMLLIAVEDEGPGVPSAERERIFEKFYRTAHGQQQTSKGLGLGLSICRDLVDALGGRIWVEEAPTGGARFVVALSATSPG